MKRAAYSTPAGTGIDLRLWAPLGILLASAGALATAYIAEYGLGLEPCVLCLYQRVPFAAGILLGAGALCAERTGHPRAGVWLVALAGAGFLAGAGVALYHVGVEQHWWESAVCGGAPLATMSIEDLQAALLAPPPKSCDAVDWTFLGLSMASWNAIVSPLLAGATLVAAASLSRTAR